MPLNRRRTATFLPASTFQRHGRTDSAPPCEPSSFICELDDEYLEHTTYDDILGAEPSTDELSNFFGNLKGMMDGI